MTPVIFSGPPPALRTVNAADGLSLSRKTPSAFVSAPSMAARPGPSAKITGECRIKQARLHANRLFMLRIIAYDTGTIKTDFDFTHLEAE